MERKINSFKRNRRRHSSYDSKEAIEAKGDEDEVANEEEESYNTDNRNNNRDESENKNKKYRDDESDFENVK